MLFQMWEVIDCLTRFADSDQSRIEGRTGAYQAVQIPGVTVLSGWIHQTVLQRATPRVNLHFALFHKWGWTQTLPLEADREMAL